MVQVGTPEEILQNPADDYVRAFFRGVDPTNVISAGDIVSDTQPPLSGIPRRAAPGCLERLNNLEREFGYVLDWNDIPRDCFNGFTARSYRCDTDTKRIEVPFSRMSSR